MTDREPEQPPRDEDGEGELSPPSEEEVQRGIEQDRARAEDG